MADELEMFAEDQEQGLLRGKPLPLNSNRLSSHLQQIASALELPMRASPKEVCQMIDGRLDVMGR